MQTKVTKKICVVGVLLCIFIIKLSQKTIIPQTLCDGSSTYLTKNTLCIGNQFGLESQANDSTVNKISLINSKSLQIKGTYIMVHAPTDTGISTIQSNDVLTFISPAVQTTFASSPSHIRAFIGNSRQTGIYMGQTPEGFHRLYTLKKDTSGNLDGTNPKLYIQENEGPVLLGSVPVGYQVKSLVKAIPPATLDVVVNSTVTVNIPLIYISKAASGEKRVGIKELNPNATLDINGPIKIANGYIKKSTTRGSFQTENTAASSISPTGFDSSISRVLISKTYEVGAGETHQVLIIGTARVNPGRNRTILAPHASESYTEVSGITPYSMFVGSDYDDDEASEYIYVSTGSMQVLIKENSEVIASSNIFKTSFPMASNRWSEDDNDFIGGLSNAGDMQYSPYGAWSGPSSINGIIARELTGGPTGKTYTFELGVGVDKSYDGQSYSGTGNIVIIVIKKKTSVERSETLRYTPSALIQSPDIPMSTLGSVISNENGGAVGGSFVAGNSVGLDATTELGAGLIAENGQPNTLHIRSLLSQRTYAPLFSVFVSANAYKKLIPGEVRGVGDVFMVLGSSSSTMGFAFGTHTNQTYGIIPSKNITSPLSPYFGFNDLSNIPKTATLFTKPDELWIMGQTDIVKGGLIVKQNSIAINNHSGTELLNVGGDIRATVFRVGDFFIVTASITNITSGVDKSTVVNLNKGTYDLAITAKWNCSLNSAAQTNNDQRNTYLAISSFAVGGDTSFESYQNVGWVSVIRISRFFFSMTNSLNVTDKQNQITITAKTNSLGGTLGYTCDTTFTILGMAK